MKKLSIILIVTLVTSVAIAKKKSTTDLMQNAFYSLTKLLPLMSNNLKFSDPKHEKLIADHITRMTHSFKESKHFEKLKSPALKPNIEAIISNLESAQVSFSNNNKNFARLRLNSSTHLCISCHSQIPKDKMVSMIINDEDLTKKLKKDYFELGNIYLILRQYKKAKKSYKKYLKEQISAAPDDQAFAYFNKNLHQALFNIVLINTKALKDPKASIKLLKELKKDLNLPPYLMSEIKLWESRAKYWNKKYPNLAKKQFAYSDAKAILKDIESKVIFSDSTILSGDYDYDLMLISGILSNMLFNKDPAQKGETLFWLGIAEYRLGKTLFYNIGDNYLKQCINDFPKLPIAKRCYDALLSEVEFRNSGTRGMNIPVDVMKELRELKAKIK